MLGMLTNYFGYTCSQFISSLILDKVYMLWDLRLIYPCYYKFMSTNYKIAFMFKISKVL